VHKGDQGESLAEKKARGVRNYLGGGGKTILSGGTPLSDSTPFVVREKKGVIATSLGGGRRRLTLVQD